MVHIYTGRGKGKTTASLGLALRASGRILRVIIFQFLKPGSVISGEELSVKRLKNVKLVKFNEVHTMFMRLEGSLKERHNELKKAIKRDFEKAKKAVISKRYDLVILDEIINVVDQNFIGQDNLLNLLRIAPRDVELVLTGRGDISGMEKYADYVTIMVDKKHPFSKNVTARKGIEY